MHPVLFSIKNLNVYTYGFFVACAFWISIFLARKEAIKNNISGELVLDLGIILVAVGIAGARLGYVVLNWTEFSNNFLDVFKIYQGGLVFSTGFLFSILASYIYIYKKKESFLNVADCIIAYVVLGHSIGRIGCFFNGCCYGVATNNFWGIEFPHLLHRVYPTQLLSSLVLIFIFIFLRVLKNFRVFRGEIFFSYILLYSGFRFFLDYIRADAINTLGFFTLFQYICVVVFCIFLVLFVYKYKSNKKRNW